MWYPTTSQNTLPLEIIRSMGINKHSVPSKYATSFSARQKRPSKSVRLTTKHVRKQEIVAIPLLPPLPQPSEHLKSVLLTINNMDHSNMSATASRPSFSGKGRKVQCAKINGFFAFRSFYAKSIKNIHYQRILSSLLSAAWKAEESKETWRRYAIIYNESRRDSDFVQWLCKSLNLYESGGDKVEINDGIIQTGNYNLMDIHVEDVYLVPK